MNSLSHNYVELESVIQNLDPASQDCRQHIAELRRAMDAACDSGVITLHQWRDLHERLADIQNRCASAIGKVR